MVRIILVILVMTAFVLAGCAVSPIDEGTSSSEGEPRSVTYGGGISLKLKNNNNLVSTTQLKSLIGENGPIDVSSVKIYISEILLYRDSNNIQMQKTDNENGYIILYRAQAEKDVSQMTNLSDYPDNIMTDLMDLGSISNFLSTNQLNTDLLGDYNYVSLRWGYFVKITGSVTVSNGVVLNTKAGEISWHMPGEDTNAPASGGGFFTHSTNGLLTSGSPEETAVQIHTGGIDVKLLNPIIITSNDILSNEQFKVTLVFNPQAIMRGKVLENTNDSVGQLWDDDRNSIDIPTLPLGVVACRGAQTVVKETYMAELHETPDAWNSQFYNVQMDVYSTMEDLDNVYSVKISTLISSNAWRTPQDGAQPTSFSNTGSQLDMYGAEFIPGQNLPILQGFTRQTNVGDSANATFYFGSDINTAGALHADTNVMGSTTNIRSWIPWTLNFTLTDIKILSNQ